MVLGAIFLLLCVLGLFCPITRVLAAPIKGYCVLWLRTDLGINVRGDAWDIVPNIPTQAMTEGDVLLTTEGGGHAAAITGFSGSQYIGNYLAPLTIEIIENWNGAVRHRSIPWNDPIIRGVYRPF